MDTSTTYREKLRLTSFVLTARSKYTEYSKSYRLLGTNDDPNANPSWTTLMASSLSWSSPGASLVLTPETRLGYYNTYRLLITQCTIGYCSIARFIPSFVTEGTVIDGTSINGTHIDTLIADVKVNSDYVAVGHLPLDGGTLTGDLTVDGEMNIGGAKISRGATNGLQLYGPSSNIGGPHIQAFVSTDDYPVFQQLNNSHGSIAMCFDAYADGFTWKSSSSDSNAIIYKSTTDLEFSYSSGIAPGGEVTWNAGFSMDLANGLVSFSNGLDVTGDITITGTVDGVDLEGLHTDVKANTAYRNTGHLPLTGGTLTGNLNMGNRDIDNVNQVFIDRKGLANNKLVLYDTNFYGFGINGGVLIYNVNNDGANHIFYYSGTNELFRISHAGVFSSRSLDVKGNLTISGTVDGVDVSALKSAVDLNTDKVSYTDATKVGLISVTQAVNLDTMESDIATNNNKVSASGTINTHSDVNLTLLKDYDVLTYFSGEWKNMPTQAPDTSAFLLANGTRAMTGTLNMGNQDIDNVNQIFIDRKTTAYNKLVLYDGGTPSTTAFYGLGIQSATLLYNVDSSAANHKFYYGGTNEVFRIGNAGVYSHRNLDVKGNIILSGTVDGVDVASLGDDVKYNTAYRNISHLPLSGGGITGDLTINGELNVGGAKIARGATSGLQLSGPSSNIAGPHIQAFVSTDTYPTYQLLNWSHNNVNICFDAYYDGAWRSSSSSSNACISKDGSSLHFLHDSGIVLGSALNWDVGFSMDLKGGSVTFQKDITVKGNITTAGTFNGYDLAALNTSINSKLPLSGGVVGGGVDRRRIIYC